MKVKVYRTVTGDTWDLIAYKIFGKEEYMHELIRANVNLIGIAVFDANIPLVIPELKMKKTSSTNLPPWKR